MSEWFSPQQLAGMPGLGSTVRAVQLRAKREGWTSQRRVGTKAMEYHVSALPKETRAALLNAALGEVATKVVRQETQLALVETNRQQLVADARQGVLHALDLMMARTGYSRKRSITLMLDMARLGQVEPQLLAMLKMARDPRGRPSADGLPSVRSLERFLDQPSVAPWCRRSAARHERSRLGAGLHDDLPGAGEAQRPRCPCTAGEALARANAQSGPGLCVPAQGRQRQPRGRAHG
ncbi:DNA-binding protein [Pseudomonas aeruginosa]|uniref:DNA-binding protein n=1 Tax=Pseudomonas aeruginosa TaxID=287 RepID=UPI001FFE192B|nr:DNA-binding protein [Pseudomonas aeruginosa]